MRFIRNLFESILSALSTPQHDPDSPGDVSQCPFLNGDLKSPEPEPELSEIQKIRKTFNSTTDLIALSKDYYGNLNEEDKEWLTSLGERAIYFEGKTLVNVGVVKTGSSYMRNFSTKV